MKDAKIHLRQPMRPIDPRLCIAKLVIKKKCINKMKAIDFKIESKIPVGNCTLKLFNLNGVLLYKKNMHKGRAELNISDFSKGVYVLKVTGREGREYRDRVIIR